jgi:hypothetical protein
MAHQYGRTVSFRPRDSHCEGPGFADTVGELVAVPVPIEDLAALHVQFEEMGAPVVALIALVALHAVVEVQHGVVV